MRHSTDFNISKTKKSQTFSLSQNNQCQQKDHVRTGAHALSLYTSSAPQYDSDTRSQSDQGNNNSSYNNPTLTDIGMAQVLIGLRQSSSSSSPSSLLGSHQLFTTEAMPSCHDLSGYPSQAMTPTSTANTNPSCPTSVMRKKRQIKTNIPEINDNNCNNNSVPIEHQPQQSQESPKMNMINAFQTNREIHHTQVPPKPSVQEIHHSFHSHAIKMDPGQGHFVDAPDDGKNSNDCIDQGDEIPTNDVGQSDHHHPQLPLLQQHNVHHKESHLKSSSCQTNKVRIVKHGKRRKEQTLQKIPIALKLYSKAPCISAKMMESTQRGKPTDSTQKNKTTDKASPTTTTSSSTTTPPNLIGSSKSTKSSSALCTSMHTTPTPSHSATYQSMGTTMTTTTKVATGMDLPKLNPYDVLCSRSKVAFKTIGNRRLRILMELMAPAYEESTRKFEKTALVSSLVNIIQSAGGNFKRRNKETGNWEVAPNEVAKEKVGHGFRDAVANRNRSIYDILGHERCSKTVLMDHVGQMLIENVAQTASMVCKLQKPPIVKSQNANEWSGTHSSELTTSQGHTNGNIPVQIKHESVGLLKLSRSREGPLKKRMRPTLLQSNDTEGKHTDDTDTVKKGSEVPLKNSVKDETGFMPHAMKVIHPESSSKSDNPLEKLLTIALNASVVAIPPPLG